MEIRMSILFYGKKTKNESDKLLSIYLRVTINGDRFEVSTQRYVETAKWSASAGKVKGNSEEARSINQHLDNLKQKIYGYQKTDHPQCLNENCLLPIPSNAKLNAYLKEVADICGITKYLTFHIARHTFATTVTLNNGVPIESISKMPGHKSIKITEIYAKILDKKVSEDMGLLRQKFTAKAYEGNLRAAQ